MTFRISLPAVYPYPTLKCKIYPDHTQKIVPSCKKRACPHTNQNNVYTVQRSFFVVLAANQFRIEISHGGDFEDYCLRDVAAP
jgi:hypothetical protein